jgi:hypothetical protein
MRNARPGWLFILLAMLAASTLLFAACGGDDDDSEEDAPTAEATADDDDDDGEDEPQPTAEDEDDDDGEDEDDPFAELEDITGEYEQIDGTVTYTVTTDGEESSWTIYSEGDNSRIDFGDEEGAFISITTPDASYTCTGSGGEGTCFEGENGLGGNPFEGLFTSFASVEAIEAYAALIADIDIETSSENVADVQASCYAATGDFEGDPGTVKWCFSDSGQLLLAQYDFESGSTELRASEFSESVPDGIFEPPYDVTDLGDLGQ